MTNQIGSGALVLLSIGGACDGALPNPDSVWIGPQALRSFGTTRDGPLHPGFRMLLSPSTWGGNETLFFSAHAAIMAVGQHSVLSTAVSNSLVFL